MRGGEASRAASSVRSAGVVTMGKTGCADDLYNCGAALCEGRAGPQGNYEGARQALHGYHAPAPRSAGSAALAAAPGPDDRRLPGAVPARLPDRATPAA